MRALAIVHEWDAGPGVFVDAVRTSRAELHSWLLPHEGPPALDPRDYDAVLTFGGAIHPDQEDQRSWIAEEIALLADLLERRVPLLGVCLGAQLLAAATGAPARRAQAPEIGWYPVELTWKASHDPVLGPLASRFDALEWHSYELRLPPGATPLAYGTNCLQAYRVGDVAWGIQFHAEVTLRDFESWLGHHRRSGDLADVSAEELRALTQARIATWNELGRGVCQRFIGRAATEKRARPRLSLGSRRNRRQ